MSSSWTCPFCGKPTTVTSKDIKRDLVDCLLDSDKGYVRLLVKYTVCPNLECKKLSLFTALFTLKENPDGYGFVEDEPINLWKLIPSSMAKSYSVEIIPKAIIEDYEEACKIKDLSPKASATLSRRALQGMIRNFWKVKKPKGRKGKWSLFHEIKAIENKVEPEVLEAINAVRKIGNIGAHMEEDVNLIIEVKPKEASKLIELIELLIEEWYINKHLRIERLKEIKDIADEKAKRKKKGGRS